MELITSFVEQNAIQHSQKSQWRVDEGQFNGGEKQSNNVLLPGC